MATLSVVVNTLNEGEFLKRALLSVKDLADEIVVVDMHSEDNSVEIAEELGARVFEHESLDYVEPARNFALSKATSDWILLMDPDEEIGPGLKVKIKEILSDPKSYDYYRLPRKNIVFGQWLKNTRWWPDYNIRLFKKGCVSWNEVIHSVPTTIGRGMDLQAEDTSAIIHYHYNTVKQFIERLNRYTTVQAVNRNKDGEKFNWTYLLTKPSGEFFSRFFFGSGYKDGVHGLATSLLQSFSELVVLLKMWEIDGFKKEMINIDEVGRVIRNITSDFNYWKADAKIKSGAGFMERIKRKYRIY